MDRIPDVEGEAQWKKLFRLLRDRKWHKPNEILRAVYSIDSARITGARVAARVGDVNRWLSDCGSEFQVKGKVFPNESMSSYRMFSFEELNDRSIAT